MSFIYVGSEKMFYDSETATIERVQEKKYPLVIFSCSGKIEASSRQNVNKFSLSPSGDTLGYPKGLCPDDMPSKELV